MFHATDRTKIIGKHIDDALHQIQESNQMKRQSSSFTYLYFIWHTPDQFLAGGATYVNAMLSAVGGINLAAQMSQERYPRLSSLNSNNDNNEAELQAAVM